MTWCQLSWKLPVFSDFSCAEDLDLRRVLLGNEQLIGVVARCGREHRQRKTTGDLLHPDG